MGGDPTPRACRAGAGGVRALAAGACAPPGSTAIARRPARRAAATKPTPPTPSSSPPDFGGSDGGDGYDDGPSRADMSDNWGGEKKFTPSGAGGGGLPARGGDAGGLADRYGADRGGTGAGYEPAGMADRYGADRGIPGDFGGPSRADSAARWGGEKKFVPSLPGDRDADRREFGGPSAADVEDRWSKKPVRSSDGGSGPGSAAGDAGPPPGARADGADGWRRATPVDGGDSRPASGATGGGRPRLALKPRSLPPPDAAAAAAATDAAAAPANNPFGAARPREAVLKDKGVDWREAEAKLEKAPRAPRAATPAATDAIAADAAEGVDKLAVADKADAPPAKAGSGRW